MGLSRAVRSGDTGARGSAGTKTARADTGTTAGEAFKRATDLVLGSVLLLALLPVMLVAGLLIWLTTRDSPLFRQTRIGRDGTPFTLYKLRTMHAGEPAGCSGLEAKARDDVRVTRIGRLLRRTSIDEAPQLWNVLTGQMSLVGPRPALPEEVTAYARPWRRRLAVRPGLSGLWQVSGRSEVPVRRWMAMDRYYVGHRSARLDLLILLRTLGAVVSMRGAW
jgi:lipopolysaccharide/colanic/teichoic acid biosynthesis glycosyltransferase